MNIKKAVTGFVIVYIMLTLAACASTQNGKGNNADNNKQEKTVFEDVGYFKIENATGGGNRSYTVYTNCTDEGKLIEYARKKMHSVGGFTYVHFYNNKENTPDITTYNSNTPELAYSPEEGKEYRIGTFQKAPNENEFWWNSDMSESKQLAGN